MVSGYSLSRDTFSIMVPLHCFVTYGAAKRLLCLQVFRVKCQSFHFVPESSFALLQKSSFASAGTFHNSTLFMSANPLVPSCSLLPGC